MGMSFHVIAERERDAEFQRMFEVLRVCKENDVSVPPEVVKFFGEKNIENYDDVETIADAAVEVDIDKLVKVVQGDYFEDRTLDLKDLPASVKRLKFRVSA